MHIAREQNMSRRIFPLKSINEIYGIKKNTAEQMQKTPMP
jgi:hypothetical protein